jgi:AraC family transcriptional activator of tynA and feaB
MQARTPPQDDQLIDPLMWTSQRIDGGISRGIWDTTISEHTAHEWHIDRPMTVGTPSFSRFRTISDSRVVAWGGDEGIRCSHDIRAARRTERQDLSIVYAAEGAAQLDIGGRIIELRAGMFTITDSSKPMTLDISSSFRHIYFIFPKSRMLSVFPFVEEFIGVPLGRDHGLLSFFLDHLSLIEHHLGTFEQTHAITVLNSTLDLLAMTLSSLDAGRIATPRERQLSRLKAYIEARLRDADLDIPTIAADNGINVRYLHKTFAGTGVTVSNWVRKRRLEMCRRDFDATALARRSVTEIALRWGFNDMSHFSKAFKREFQMGPREYRSRGVEK